MREIEDPPRLLETDDAPAELRTWLRRAQGDSPSASEAEELVRSVERRMAAGPRAARGHRGTAKVVVALAVVGIGIGGWRLAARNHSSERSSGVAASRLAPPTAPTVAPAAPAPAGLPVPPPDQIPVAPAAAKPPVVRSHVKDRETVHRTTVEIRKGIAPVEQTPPDEFALLRAARQAMAEHPASALALTDQHARRFPTGMLAQEREAIAIEALAQLGRGEQAAVRARTFLAAHPESPYKSRIEAALRRISHAQRSP